MASLESSSSSFLSGGNSKRQMIIFCVHSGPEIVKLAVTNIRELINNLANAFLCFSKLPNKITEEMVEMLQIKITNNGTDLNWVAFN